MSKPPKRLYRAIWTVLCLFDVVVIWPCQRVPECDAECGFPRKIRAFQAGPCSLVHPRPATFVDTPLTSGRTGNSGRGPERIEITAA